LVAWDFQDAQEKRRLHTPHDFDCTLRWSDDGRWIAVIGISGDKLGKAWLWDAVTDREVAHWDRSGAIEKMAAAIFTRDSKRLCLADSQGSLQIWELSAKPHLLSRRETKRFPRNASFSADGQLCALANDEALELWTTVGNQPPIVLVSKAQQHAWERRRNQVVGYATLGLALVVIITAGQLWEQAIDGTGRRVASKLGLSYAARIVPQPFFQAAKTASMPAGYLHQVRRVMWGNYHGCDLLLADLVYKVGRGRATARVVLIPESTPSLPDFQVTRRDYLITKLEHLFGGVDIEYQDTETGRRFSGKYQLKATNPEAVRRLFADELLQQVLFAHCRLYVGSCKNCLAVRTRWYAFGAPLHTETATRKLLDIATEVHSALQRSAASAELNESGLV
jgi:hypothetical protein